MPYPAGHRKEVKRKIVAVPTRSLFNGVARNAGTLNGLSDFPMQYNQHLMQRHRQLC
jgi:hypothetical protein